MVHLVSSQKPKSESLQIILEPFQDEIANLERVMFGLIESQVPFVRHVAEYVLKNGGKRMRPILTMVCTKLLQGDAKKSYKMGSCVEFIHTASLLHDDVIDNAEIRRGQPTTNTKWGNHVSVLVGDFFYCRASQLLTEQGDLKILKIITDCITATTEGEVLEIVKNADINTRREDYLSIIKNKTALLLAAACQVGAILGGADEEQEHAIKDYGFNLGMAFQLADDILDYNSSEDVFGKAKGIDLQEGKLTLPLIVALRQVNEEESQIIKMALDGKSLEDDTFANVHAIINKYHGFEQTYELAKEYIEKAKTALHSFDSSKEKDALIALADYVIAREH
jgi:octaprenyl-diphosphate synthase